jgi:hypothetical protein
MTNGFVNKRSTVSYAAAHTVRLVSVYYILFSDMYSSMMYGKIPSVDSPSQSFRQPNRYVCSFSHSA